MGKSMYAGIRGVDSIRSKASIIATNAISCLIEAAVGHILA